MLRSRHRRRSRQSSASSTDSGAESHRSSGQSRGELVRDLLHPTGGHRGVAVGQHPEDHVEHPSAVPEVGVELDPTHQRSEEPLDDGLGEARLAQCDPGGDVVASEQPGRIHATKVLEAWRHGACRRSNRSAPATSTRPWSACGTDRTPPNPCPASTPVRRDRTVVVQVHRGRTGAPTPDTRSALPGIRDPPGIRRSIGAHASADAIARLQDDDVDAARATRPHTTAPPIPLR